MIDFRYHIVSIVAVFLALGIGILLGTSVLATGTVKVLESNVNRLDSGLRSARADITDLKKQRDQANTLADELAPWVVPGRLNGVKVVTVTDGGGRWHDTIRDAVAAAGAQSVGALTLTDRWKLDAPGSVEELVGLVRGVIPSFDPGSKPAETALNALGTKLFDDDGQALLRKLVDAKFITVDGADLKTVWPPRGAAILADASAFPKAAQGPTGWLAAFAQGSASVTGTLVVSAQPADASAVTVLRGAGTLPSAMSTFDAGASPAAKIGAPLALDAALRGHGGHFGADPGRFVPEPG